jgi:hypothetical protein
MQHTYDFIGANYNLKAAGLIAAHSGEFRVDELKQRQALD